KLILMKLSQPAFSVLGRLHSESVLSQKAFQNSGKRLIVFDQEDFRHNQSGPVANGTLKNKKESRNILPDFLLTAKKQVGTPPRLPLPEKKDRTIIPIIRPSDRPCQILRWLLLHPSSVPLHRCPFRHTCKRR